MKKAIIAVLIVIIIVLAMLRFRGMSFFDQATQQKVMALQKQSDSDVMRQRNIEDANKRQRELDEKNAAA